jgi:hypothetical protein
MERDVVSKIYFWTIILSCQVSLLFVSGIVEGKVEGKVEGRKVLTTLGTQLWFIYTKSLLRFMCCSRPIWTVAYVALSASVQGGKAILAKRAKGGRVTVEWDFVVKSFSVEN